MRNLIVAAVVMSPFAVLWVGLGFRRGDSITEAERERAAVRDALERRQQ